MQFQISAVNSFLLICFCLHTKGSIRFLRGTCGNSSGFLDFFILNKRQLIHFSEPSSRLRFVFVVVVYLSFNFCYCKQVPIQRPYLKKLQILMFNNKCLLNSKTSTVFRLPSLPIVWFVTLYGVLLVYVWHLLSFLNDIWPYTVYSSNKKKIVLSET